MNLGTAVYLSSLTMGIASGTGSFSNHAIVNDVVIRATSTGSNMMLQTGSGNSAIYINSSNNVGIGTNNPNATLQITNSSAVGAGYGALLVDSPNSGAAGGCITIRNSAGGANAFASLIFEIDGSTSCQTGSTPGAYAAGNGMIYCQNVGVGNNAGKLGFIQWNGSGEVETMTILPSGNVGINNTTPKSLLSVLGVKLWLKQERQAMMWNMLVQHQAFIFEETEMEPHR